jgi:hypothetical protein
MYAYPIYECIKTKIDTYIEVIRRHTTYWGIKIISRLQIYFFKGRNTRIRIAFNHQFLFFEVIVEQLKNACNFCLINWKLNVIKILKAHRMRETEEKEREKARQKLLYRALCRYWIVVIIILECLCSLLCILHTLTVFFCCLAGWNTK